VIEWKHELGKHFLQHGALSYILSDENGDVSWGEDSHKKQQIDMVVYYKDHIRVVELKETDSTSHRNIKPPQIKRYQTLCGGTKYDTEFWAFVYWKRYRTITGYHIIGDDNIKFMVVKNDGYVSFVIKEGQRKEKERVDFQMKV